MQRLEVSGAVRPIYGSLGVKQLNKLYILAWNLPPTHYRCRGLLLHLTTLTDTHTFGLPWTRVRSFADNSTHNIRKRQTSMSPTKFVTATNQRGAADYAFYSAANGRFFQHIMYSTNSWKCRIASFLCRRNEIHINLQHKNSLCAPSLSLHITSSDQPRGLVGRVSDY